MIVVLAVVVWLKHSHLWRNSDFPSAFEIRLKIGETYIQFQFLRGYTAEASESACKKTYFSNSAFFCNAISLIVDEKYVLVIFEKILGSNIHSASWENFLDSLSAMAFFPWDVARTVLYFVPRPKVVYVFAILNRLFHLQLPCLCI